MFLATEDLNDSIQQNLNLTVKDRKLNEGTSLPPRPKISKKCYAKTESGRPCFS